MNGKRIVAQNELRSQYLSARNVASGA